MPKRTTFLFSLAEQLEKAHLKRLEAPSDAPGPEVTCNTCEGHGFVQSDPCGPCDGTGALVMSDEDIAILKADERYDRDRDK